MARSDSDPSKDALPTISRRSWIKRSIALTVVAATGGGIWAFLDKKNRKAEYLEEQRERPGNLSERETVEPFKLQEYETLRFAADTVLPGEAKEGLPSASEAHVLRFIRRLSRKNSGVLEASRALCAHLDRLAGEKGSSSFSQLSETDRIWALSRMQADPSSSTYVVFLIGLCLRGFTLPDKDGRKASAWDALGLPREIPFEEKGAVAWKIGP